MADKAQNPLLSLKWKVFTNGGEMVGAFQNRIDCGSFLASARMVNQTMIVKHNRTTVWVNGQEEFNVTDETVTRFADIIGARALGE